MSGFFSDNSNSIFVRSTRYGGGKSRVSRPLNVEAAAVDIVDRAEYCAVCVKDMLDRELLTSCVNDARVPSLDGKCMGCVQQNQPCVAMSDAAVAATRPVLKQIQDHPDKYKDDYPEKSRDLINQLRIVIQGCPGWDANLQARPLSSSRAATARVSKNGRVAKTRSASKKTRAVELLAKQAQKVKMKSPLAAQATPPHREIIVDSPASPGRDDVVMSGPAEPAAPKSVLGQLEELAKRVAHLEKMTERVAQVEKVTERVAHVEKVSERVAHLEKVLGAPETKM